MTAESKTKQLEPTMVGLRTEGLIQPSVLDTKLRQLGKNGSTDAMRLEFFHDYVENLRAHGYTYTARNKPELVASILIETKLNGGRFDDVKDKWLPILPPIPKY